MPCSCLCSATRVPQGSRPRAVLRVQQQPARVQDLHRQQGLVAAAAPARRNWRRRAVGRSDSDSVAASDADASDSSSESSSSHLGLVIECDGALIDAHVDGHRVAFNRAFAEIGHDCTNWSPMVRGGEGRRWLRGSKGKGKVDPPWELAYLGTERSAGKLDLPGSSCLAVPLGG